MTKWDSIIAQLAYDQSFIMATLVIALILLIAGRIYCNKRNFVPWLVTAGQFYIFVFVAAIVVTKLGYLNSDIFWGVFVASILGFIGSIFLQKYIEVKTRMDAKTEEAEDLEHAVRVLRLEMEQNFNIAEHIHTYLNKYRSLPDDDLKQRKDALFYRFSIISQETLWHKIVEALEASKLKEVQETYSEFVHLNHLLDTVCDYLSRNMKVGHLHQDYKSVLDTHPWSIQLNNRLADCINRKNATLERIQ